MTLKAAIFDFDGVLSDSLPTLFNWMQHLYRLTKRQFPFCSIEKFKEAIKEPYSLMYPELGFDWEAEKDFILQEYFKYMEKNSSPLFPGVEEIIKELYNKELDLAIASSKISGKIRQELNNHNLQQYFRSIIGRDNLSLLKSGEPRMKPYPDCLLITLDRLGYSPLETIYFGDQPTDVEAARRVKDFLGAAMPVVCTTYGYASIDKILDFGVNPDMYIDRPEDILKIL